MEKEGGKEGGREGGREGGGVLARDLSSYHLLVLPPSLPPSLLSHLVNNKGKAQKRLFFLLELSWPGDAGLEGEE